MKGKIVLDVRKNQLRKSGFPVVVKLANKGSKKLFSLGICFLEKEWDSEKQEPKNDKRKILFIRKKKLALEELLFDALDNPRIDFEHIKSKLLGSEQNITSGCFYEFAEFYVGELKKKVDDKGFAKIGNALTYEAALAQMKVFRSQLLLSDIDYTLLSNFKNWQYSKGNKKNTIAAYMKSYRALYKEAVRRGLVDDKKPFDGIFKGITVKKNRTQKKHINKETIKLLEGINNLPEGRQTVLDLWLLQFYFGGLDFKDLYYLENYQISKGRVFFTRGKLDDNGYQFDLKIFPKAQKILDKYRVKDGRFVFPWRKDYTGYKTFYSRVLKNLKRIQDDFNINIEPLGGNFATKVSRHTFATIGSRLFIEPDLLRTLMGHERDDIDTVYKDVYPQEVRDEYHFKIIDTN
ncbi:phage integrase SAM-like domain-containing protein [Tenacibaculum sp. TC6]|uniref:phage integrase SAM-like domain-containing protein n=1 Tax=Tenacibaculum sp. TC6 TaxID=3423223 RepID=UPI003D35DC10